MLLFQYQLSHLNSFSLLIFTPFSQHHVRFTFLHVGQISVFLFAIIFVQQLILNANNRKDIYFFISTLLQPPGHAAHPSSWRTPLMIIALIFFPAVYTRPRNRLVWYCADEFLPR